jgi:beta-phosphoglucomutase
MPMQTFPLALIFDLNGTMIDDMEFHLNAWTEILNKDLNAKLSRKQVRSQMYGKNSELLVRVFGEGKFSEDEMEYWSREKEKRYQKAYLPHLQLIKGLKGLLDKAMEKKIPMAIGSAAIPFNIDFVLDNLDIRKYFSAIVSADDVAFSKPDPETFLKAAELLHMEPSGCLVFEDAPKGVEAATRAGMKTVVLTTMHNRNDFPQTVHILAFIKDYSDPFVLSLF